MLLATPRDMKSNSDTGGSGFIAAHVLDILLERGHTVVTTVRSEEKAQKIREAHPGIPTSKLDFRIVEDIAHEGAFDEAVKIDGLEAVVHTASPVCFHTCQEGICSTVANSQVL